MVCRVIISDGGITTNQIATTDDIQMQLTIFTGIIRDEGILILILTGARRNFTEEEGNENLYFSILNIENLKQ